MMARPPKHLFIADPDAPPDHRKRRWCKAWADDWRCALPEDHPVHVSADELLPETPPEDESDRWIGEG